MPSKYAPNPDIPGLNPLSRGIARLVITGRFQYTILGIILLAAIIVGMETSPYLMEHYGKWLKRIDSLILLAFIIEALLKMAAHGKRWYRYFLDPWNVFDFLIIVVCLLPMEGQFAAVLRLARVLRALRLVSAAPKLQLLVGALLRSIPSMLWVGILLGLLFYIYAVLGVSFFRDNDPVHFRDLHTSLLTLFRVVTLEDWTDVMYIQMYGSDVYPNFVNSTDLPVTPKGQPILAAFFFVSFVLMGTMIMLNLFIGVIISSMDEAQAEAERRERMQHIEETGSTTVNDEIILIEHELDSLKNRLKELRQRP